MAALDFEIPQPTEPFLLAIRHAKHQTSRSGRYQLLDLLRYATFTGQFNGDEYYAYRLFDRSLWSDEEIKRFMGRAKQRKAILRCNTNSHWYGAVEDKLVSGMLFAAAGLQVPKIKAWVHPSRAHNEGQWLKDADEFRTFLRDANNFPAFMKPNNSSLSLGAATIDHYDAEGDKLVSSTGSEYTVDEFVEACTRYFKNGYIVQERLQPHPELRSFSGNSVSTVRLLTVRDDKGVRVTKSAVKIASGANACDNFWRQGNVLGHIDITNGRVTKVLTGKGVEQRDLSSDDPGGQFIGWSIPDWKEFLDTACRGMNALPSMHIIGWDIAITANGPVVLEGNTVPDLHLIQMVERRGFDDAEFQSLINYCEKQARINKRNAKKKKRAHRDKKLANIMERAKAGTQGAG